jgi:hypothetical protein
MADTMIEAQEALVRADISRSAADAAAERSAASL